MSREKEMKLCAGKLVWITDDLNNNEKLRDYEADELKEQLWEIQKEIMESGYDIDLITKYMDEYRNVKLGDYHKWLNGGK